MRVQGLSLVYVTPWRAVQWGLRACARIVATCREMALRMAACHDVGVAACHDAGVGAATWGLRACARTVAYLACHISLSVPYYHRIQFPANPRKLLIQIECLCAQAIAVHDHIGVRAGRGIGFGIED